MKKYFWSDFRRSILLCFLFLKCRLGFEIAVSIVIEEKSEEIIIIRNWTKIFFRKLWKWNKFALKKSHTQCKTPSWFGILGSFVLLMRLKKRCSLFISFLFLLCVSKHYHSFLAQIKNSNVIIITECFLIQERRSPIRNPSILFWDKMRSEHWIIVSSSIWLKTIAENLSSLEVDWERS